MGRSSKSVAKNHSGSGPKFKTRLTLNEVIEGFMETKGIEWYNFRTDSGLTDNLVSELKNKNKVVRRTPRILISICAGLRLTPRECDLLLQAGGVVLIDSGEEQIYQKLIDSGLTEYGYEECNKYLLIDLKASKKMLLGHIEKKKKKKKQE
ncbi:MAG: hypothetical protein E7235_00960 [Lachnospiraceae bacterium]|nr:hypothetical protein [Lachnospiraceae bacterium]